MQFSSCRLNELLGNIKLYISLISPPNHHFAGPAEKKSDSNHHPNLPALEGRKRVHGLSGLPLNRKRVGGLSGLPLNRKRVGGLSGLPLNRKRIHGLSILALNLLQRLPVTLKWREAFHIKKKPSKFPREETKIGRSCFHNSTLQNKTSLKSNGPCPTKKNEMLHVTFPIYILLSLDFSPKNPTPTPKNCVVSYGWQFGG